MFEQNIFARLAEWQADGLATGLATLIAVDGSSPRPRGAQIGVGEDGRHLGMISSGCAEEAIIAEALDALKQGKTHITRYGKGSPYLDIVLPCGSGLDILFSGQGIGALTAQVQAFHGARQTAYVTVDGQQNLAVSAENAPDAMAYPPDYHLHVFGAGVQLICFAQLAHVMGYKLHVTSTDADARKALLAAGIDSDMMSHKTQFDINSFDEHSAVIILFHEHNLELPILETALNSNAHYIGALGSRKTHAQRNELLAMRPPTARPFSDITGPVGLDIGAADPSEIALSILAQIVAHRRGAIR